MFSPFNAIDAVDRAVETAVLNTGVPTPDSFALSLASLPDDEPVTINTDFEAGPGQIIIDDAADFPRYYGLLHGLYNLHFDDTTIASTVSHERQHDSAARQLGSQRSIFGIELCYWQDDEYDEPQLDYARAFNVQLHFTTTKLRLALITAHPRENLTGDLRRIIETGYSGIQELGDIAIARNQNGENLPIPSTYRGARTSSETINPLVIDLKPNFNRA